MTNFKQHRQLVTYQCERRISSIYWHTTVTEKISADMVYCPRLTLGFPGNGYLTPFVNSEM